MTRTIYISQDPNLTEVLDKVSQQLAARGWHVVRGPAITPGVPLRLTPRQRVELLADADVVVVSSRSRFTGEDMDAAPRLRAIIFPSIGVDAVDLAECTERGIIVGHGAMAENFLAMSEATIMLMLVLLYRLDKSQELLRDSLPRPQRMHARMLRGRTIGLIGSGRIGSGVIGRLKDWGAQLLVYDPYLRPEMTPKGARLVPKEELLANSDIVSLHVPLNAETRNTIGEAELRSMKPSAILINTSRGGLIDEEALVRVMNKGHLAGAGLDVFETEPLPADHPLRALDRVILTPHILGHTMDLFDVMPDVLVENVERVMLAELPTYTKNQELESRWRERLARIGA
jgi:D-3-phosphoglycerate dehydrogenase